MYHLNTSITSFISSPWRLVKRLFYAGWLPLLLTLLFVGQNQAFNSWLGINPGLYVIRRSLVTFALGLVLYGPALMFKKPIKYIYLFLMSGFISLIFATQFVYFKCTHDFLLLSAGEYIELAATQTDTIISALSIHLLFFTLNIFACVVGLIIEYWQKNHSIFLSFKEKIVAVLIITIIALTSYGHLLRAEAQQWGSTTHLYSNLFNLNILVSKIGIINFFLEDLSKRVLNTNRITTADKNFLEKWSQNRSKPPAAENFFGLAKNRNVIFIQIESLENAVINQGVNGEQITPRLNQLAKEGLYFTNYYSPTANGTTADVEFAVLNSLYPLPDGVAFVKYPQNHYFALPELLRKNGYHTYSLHGDRPNFWNRDNVYPQLGYEKSFSIQDYTVNRSVGSGFKLSDEDFFNQSILKLKNLPQPFMATLMTYTSHPPFVIPADLQTLHLPAQTNLNETQKKYSETIHYTDQTLGNFIDQLKQNNLYDNSLILIYGDHGSYPNIGQALKTNNKILPALNGNHVPLIILAPKTELQGITDTPASHLDLYPTVANLLGITPPASTLGQDIFNTDTPVFVSRHNFSGTINTIISSQLAYKSSDEGIYEYGTCYELPGYKSIPVEACRDLYDRQNDIIKISDIAIRGNFLDLLEANTNFQTKN
ncbi:MAG: LTA synthase family protein [Patescibacteria group bacterium]|jgi:phosphoglycerol transferase MdoB-like AlkP superfamily enzyme